MSWRNEMEIRWAHSGSLRHLLGSNNINSLGTGCTVKLIGPLKTDLCDDWPSLSLGVENNKFMNEEREH